MLLGLNTRPSPSLALPTQPSGALLVHSLLFSKLNSCSFRTFMLSLLPGNGLSLSTTPPISPAGKLQSILQISSEMPFPHGTIQACNSHQVLTEKVKTRTPWSQPRVTTSEALDSSPWCPAQCLPHRQGLPLSCQSSTSGKAS